MKPEGIFAAIFADAARETGRTQEQLETMAVQVFATMLHHMMQERGSVVWTAARLEQDNRLTIEVNIVPRFGSRNPVRNPS